MIVRFYDTSALAKYYRGEPGSVEVRRLIVDTDTHQVVSRLCITELHSVFAKKVRTGDMSPKQMRNLLNALRRDARNKLFRILQLDLPHYRSADMLILTRGLARNLRTLDALQLSVALAIRLNGDDVEFICADVALAGAARDAGLKVINPEAP
jgi:predicted nucleic acid-binding protein